MLGLRHAQRRGVEEKKFEGKQMEETNEAVKTSIRRIAPVLITRKERPSRLVEKLLLRTQSLFVDRQVRPEPGERVQLAACLVLRRLLLAHSFREQFAKTRWLESSDDGPGKIRKREGKGSLYLGWGSRSSL